MRNSLLLFMVLLYSTIAFGQEMTSSQQPNKKYTYCELVEKSYYFNSNVELIFSKGDEINNTDPRYKYENGKRIVFKTLLDGMNYMSSLGRELVETYVEHLNLEDNYTKHNRTIHWILRKEIKE